MQRRDRLPGDVGTQAKKNCKEVSLDHPPSPDPLPRPQKQAPDHHAPPSTRPGSSSRCLININYIKCVVIHSSYSGLLFLLKGNCFPSYSCHKLCVNELKTN